MGRADRAGHPQRTPEIPNDGGAASARGLHFANPPRFGHFGEEHFGDEWLRLHAEHVDFRGVRFGPRWNRLEVRIHVGMPEREEVRAYKVQIIGDVAEPTDHPVPTGGRPRTFFGPVRPTVSVAVNADADHVPRLQRFRCWVTRWITGVWQQLSRHVDVREV